VAIYSQIKRDQTNGDVVGPGSATDDNLAAFDGTTGKLLKDSGIATGDVVLADASLTDFAVVCGDTASKNVQSIAGLGTSGQVLTSNGAGALPTFQAAAAGDVTGPGSSTDNALSRWDGTGGDTLQDSTVLVSDNGEMTNGSQPAFYAFLGTTDTNVTGDGTIYSLGDTDIGSALTEVFDNGGNFTPGASGGAFFTAPVTGVYQFNFSLLFQDGTTSHTYQIQIVDDTPIEFRYGNYAAGQPAGNFPMAFSICIKLTASQTVKFQAIVGASTKVVDIKGGGDNRTNISGFLVG
jgi:hypothetical protein